MKLFKNIIYTIIVSSISFGGTIYFSKSFDEFSKYSKTEESLNMHNYNTSGVYALGYYQQVWKKRKTNYSVGLGLEYLTNDDINFTSFYSMLNYFPIKNLTSSVILGTNFFKITDESSLNNQEIYKPSTKGGLSYGIIITYMIGNVPISIDYKVYMHSAVSNDSWQDFEFQQVSITSGYKF